MKQYQNFEEEMFRKKIVNVISQTEPNEAQKQRVFEACINKEYEKRAGKPKALRVAAAVVIMLSIIGISTVGVNAATDGEFFRILGKFCGLNKEQKQVAREVFNLPNEVYASELAVCTTDYVVFANERAMMVYDRNQKELVYVLDLQSIECNFFDTDTIETHIYLKNNNIYIFNDKIESKWGSEKKWDDDMFKKAYVYDLSLTGDKEALTVIYDEAKIKMYKSEWESYRKENVCDTFDTMQSENFDLNGKYVQGINYSKDCIKWVDENGNICISCLAVAKKDKEYVLYTQVGNDTKPVKEVLFNGIIEEMSDNNSLPRFIYSGNDEVLRVVCAEVLKEEDNYYMEEGMAFIPAPVIYKVLEDGDELVVFCNMRGFGYYKNGDILVCSSGGAVPARLKLKLNEDNSYIVTENLQAGDGADLDKDIKEFCKGYPVSPEIYSVDEAEWIKQRKELLRMYVEDNNLNIRYYKDSGDDHLKIW